MIHDKQKTIISILDGLRKARSDTPRLLPRLATLSVCIADATLTLIQQGKITQHISPSISRKGDHMPSRPDIPSVDTSVPRIQCANVSYGLRGSREEPFSV